MLLYGLIVALHFRQRVSALPTLPSVQTEFKPTNDSLRFLVDALSQPVVGCAMSLTPRGLGRVEGLKGIKRRSNQRMGRLRDKRGMYSQFW